MGVDVGGSSIKVVELQVRDNTVHLLTYGEVQLGPYAGKAIGSAPQLSPKQEQEALVDVIRESAVKTRNAVFAMPLSASLLSTETIEASEDADLDALVRLTARNVIPASLSEVTLDWAELDAETGKRTVLLAAIQNTAVERFKVLLQFAGFGAAPTEIECFSTNRAASTNKSSVIIDCGATTTKMYISHAGVLYRMHRVNVGGATVTQAFATETSRTFEAAETQKINLTPADESYAQLQQCYTKKYGRAVREFTQVFTDHCQTHNIAVEEILVCGGASVEPQLQKMLSESFSLPVSQVQPFAQVAYPAFMEDAIADLGPGFVPAVGAALRMFE